MNGEQQPAATETDTDGWHGLSSLVIWANLAKTVAALAPAVAAVVFFGSELDRSALWALALLAGYGLLSAAADTVRWRFTSYRITETDIERRTGRLVRQHRAVSLDRIRSVETSAKLRHRLVGLRVVTVGAGQQLATGESAFVLDALTRADADRLRHRLLRTTQISAVSEAPVSPAQEELPSALPGAEQTLAVFRPSWVFYNAFSIWGYLGAAGLFWGAHWFLSLFGINLLNEALRLSHSLGLGGFGIALTALVGGGLLGSLVMVSSFFATNWGFVLSRTRSETGSYLRTRRGLFSTREVNRDESRIRGLTLGEPQVWRWIGMTDTNVISTGLALGSPAQPSTILPRGPKGLALRVSAQVLGSQSILTGALTRHPAGALLRRLGLATVVSAVLVGAVVAPVAAGQAPTWLLWAAAASWPVALLLAWLASRALGHKIHADYLVIRSGVLHWLTSALRRDAVSTVAVRQSLLQRALGLATVSAMTSAGVSTYDATDLGAGTAIGFARQAAPGILDEFLVPAGGDVQRPSA